VPPERAHRARDAELIDFFQNAPIAMHWLNGEGIVLWANQTELNVLGYTAEEYIGKPIMNFCPDESDLVLEIFKQLGSGNAIADVPVRFRTKDGRIVHLLIDSNVAYNKDGSFGHTRCFIRDDTARKVRDARTKLLLEETERVRGRGGEGFCGRSFSHLLSFSRLIVTRYSFHSPRA
jgi:PAS domain S-box-containing protein